MKTETPYSLPVSDVASQLQTNALLGLTASEAEIRIKKYGLNGIAKEKKKSLWKILLQQFMAPVIYLLIAAAGISFFLSDIAEGIAIIVVIFINAGIGFYMEWQAIVSMDALKKMDIMKARVIRNGELSEINSEELTIGDLISIEAGDVIPADARITEARQMQCDESALTGESMPVEKNDSVVEGETVIAEQRNMLFKGTIATQGNAKALVTSIGIATEIGKISEMVKTAEQSTTPLEQKLESLTRKLIWFTVVLAAAFFITGLIKGDNLLVMLETSIAMAVAAIPEGLPIVATIALAFGMLKMAKKNVIVKHLGSVETLGSTNVILTDKTGTLTQNKISVSKVIPAPIANETSNPIAEEHLLRIALLCNNASLKNEKQIGDPLEISLLLYAVEKKLDTNAIQDKYKRTDEIPFSSDTKMMATLHSVEGGFYVAAKGAVEEIINLCTSAMEENGKQLPLSNAEKNATLQHAEKLAKEGIRVLGFAFNESKEKPAEDFAKQLTFAGLIGFIDPPHPKVEEAIDQCHEAGIKVVMLTGDHPSTALNIARQVHLAENDDTLVINGKQLNDLDKMSDEEKQQILKSHVFARVNPKQKLDIVSLYQQNNHIAAMTGDGVNDAPALKKADIGIAMGLRGTQIAKDTADIVLQDDTFISIVAAVRYGRIIFENIRKCIIFLLSCNLSEILVISATAFLDVASPLTPLQILYLNLVTDVFPALALGMGRGNTMTMKHPPRNPKDGIITKKDWKNIIAYAIIMTISIFSVFVYCHYYLKLSHQLCNNIVFMSLALAQLLHVFNLSGSDVSFFNNEITRNRYIWYSIVACGSIMLLTYLIVPFRNLLEINYLQWNVFATITVAGVLPVVFIQFLKRLKIIG